MNHMISKTVKIILGVVIALVVVYFMPFITVNTKDSEGNTYKVPFGSSFVKKDDGKITFKSFRSTYALNKDAENAFYSYGESECYGKTYFYDKENDISYYEHSASGVLPTTLEYSYESGNACAGWTVDDEVAWEFGDIDDVDFAMTLEQASEAGYFVISDGNAINVNQYNDFSRLVKQGVYSYLRTVIYENGQMEKVVDIQLLSDARFRVQIRTTTDTTDQTYARFSDLEKDDGTKDVCVYEKAYKDAEPIVLFTVK